jgi:hypothetical protein
MERQPEIIPPQCEEMGDPTIEVPEVDDLLKQLKKVTSPDLRTINFTIEEVFVEPGRCYIGCTCLPCLQGACGGCSKEIPS